MNLTKAIRLTTLLFVVFWPTTAAEAQVTAIKAGKLIDPDTGTTAVNQTIIIEGGKIKAVGTSLPWLT